MESVEVWDAPFQSHVLWSFYHFHLSTLYCCRSGFPRSASCGFGSSFCLLLRLVGIVDNSSIKLCQLSRTVDRANWYQYTSRFTKLPSEHFLSSRSGLLVFSPNIWVSNRAPGLRRFFPSDFFASCASAFRTLPLLHREAAVSSSSLFPLSLFNIFYR